MCVRGPVSCVHSILTTSHNISFLCVSNARGFILQIGTFIPTVVHVCGGGGEGIRHP